VNAAVGFALFAAALGGSAVYYAAPSLACRTRPFLRASLPSDPEKTGPRRAGTLPAWLDALRGTCGPVVVEAGYRASWAWLGYLACLTVVPALLAVVGLLAGRGAGASLGVALAVAGMTRAVVTSRTASRSRALTRSAYKAYRFLDAQVGSGIRATDAIRGLHEVMDDPVVKDVFVRFVATYELTLDLGRALDELRRSFKGHDSEMLCVAIRQCVETGGGGRMLWRMEEIMFSKYFNGMQKETEGVRTRLVVAALLAASPLVMLFLLPILFDAYRALGSILT
jgi:Flp pilus assembly protein TadB